MRVPAPILQLLAAFLFTTPSHAGPHPHSSKLSGFAYNELRDSYDCGGETCGWNNQLCCDAGSACYTDSYDQAQCTPVAGSYSSAAVSQAGGYWAAFTTTYTLTDLQTVTSTGSSYAGGATVSAAAGDARCNYALDETPCGSICCSGGQYCIYLEQCAVNSLASTIKTGATSGITVVPAPGPPLIATSSGQLTSTETVSPTTTVPFETPVATGANVTMTESQGGGGGLSGGAIAGIVIGVLLGLALLALLCFCCCVKGLLDGCLALFGLGGGRKRKRTEIDEYERRTHHSSRHGASGGRTWYGAAKKPSRVERRDKRESHSGRNAAGILGGLGALWAVLGLKRHHNKKHEEKYSDYSYTDSSYMGTSASKS